jgi:predicted nucleic acid-binding protein
MTSFLLDTNVLSETTQRSPNEKAVSWLRTVPRLLIPAVAVYEIALGIKQLPLGKKRMFLEAWLDELLGPNAEVIPLDRKSVV